MKITVLGATGLTGLLVVQQALDLGHSVTTYARRPGTLAPHPNLRVVVGDLNDTASLETAFRDSEAVISCLGPRRGVKAPGMMSNAMPKILAAMRAAGVPRIAILSAIGVGESRRKTSWLMRRLYPIVAGAVFDDKLKSEKLLAASDRDWTLVYPPILTDGPRTGAVQRRDLNAVQRLDGMAKVSRADTADVLVDAAINGKWSRKTIVVTP